MYYIPRFKFPYESHFTKLHPILRRSILRRNLLISHQTKLPYGCLSLTPNQITLWLHFSLSLFTFSLSYVTFAANSLAKVLYGIFFLCSHRLTLPLRLLHSRYLTCSVRCFFLYNDFSSFKLLRWHLQRSLVCCPTQLL